MSLPKSVVKSSGLCNIKFFKHSDVLTWPSINPLTGVMDAAVTLKPGAVLYYANTIDNSRSFEENTKSSDAGTYVEMSVSGSLSGIDAQKVLSVSSMIGHQWGVIAEDRNEVNRLIGNEDSGATLSYNYTSGTRSNPRKAEINFKWEHPLPAPIYTAQAFDIIIGGVLVTASSLQLIIRFKVGAPGAPMAEGDTLLINSLLVNKKLLIMIDGMGIPIDDFSGAIDWTGSIQRHAEKALASNTINFIGSVNNEEIVEIYAFS